MANAKISQLPAVTSAAGSDLAVAVASGTTSQVTIDNLFKNRTLVAPALGTPASGTLTNCTGLPVSTGVAGLGTGVATALAINVGTAGAPVVLNGALGTPSSGTLTNATGLPVATGISGLGTNVATALATNVGSAGAVVVNGGALGTPASGNLSNCTDVSLTTGVTGTLPVANGGTGITAFGTGVATALGQNVSGSGSIALTTSPTFTTPTLGVAAATTVNKVTLTAPATGSTLTIADGKTLTANASLTLAGTDAKTLTVSNSLTLAGTDGTTMTFPTTSATLARTDAANSFTGNQTIGGAVITTPDTRNGPGAVSVTTTTTAFTSTGTGDALTLADGTTGQIKTIVYVAEAAGGDTGVLTPTNRIGYASITLNAVGDSVTLQFIGTAWAVLAVNGATITP